MLYGESGSLPGTYGDFLVQYLTEMDIFDPPPSKVW